MAARTARKATPAPTPPKVEAPPVEAPSVESILTGRTILGVDLISQDDASALAALTLAEDGRVVASVAFKSAQMLGRTSVKRFEDEHGIPRGTVQVLQIVGACLLRIGPSATVVDGRNAAKVYGFAKSGAKFWAMLDLPSGDGFGPTGLPSVPSAALSPALAAAAAKVTAERAAKTAAAARPNDGSGDAAAATARRTSVAILGTIAKDGAALVKRLGTPAEDGEAESFRAAYALVVQYGRGRGFLTPRGAATPPVKAAARKTA